MNLTRDALADPKSFRSHRKFHTDEKKKKKSGKKIKIKKNNKFLWFHRHLNKSFIFTHCRKMLLQHIMEHCHMLITVSGTNYL